jgi:hypothetical protein
MRGQGGEDAGSDYIARLLRGLVAPPEQRRNGLKSAGYGHFFSAAIALAAAATISLGAFAILSL